MSSETYVLAPSKIATKARELASLGLYKEALELLGRHCVQAVIYPTRVEMRMATDRPNAQTKMLSRQRAVKTRYGSK